MMHERRMFAQFHNTVSRTLTRSVRFGMIGLCLLTTGLHAQSPSGPSAMEGGGKIPPVITNADITRSVAPVAPPQPALAEAVLSRLLAYSRSVQPHGIYFETLDGQPVVGNNPDALYNPASVTKVMTSLAAMDRLGAEYRYPTRISYTGEIDQKRGALVGDVIVEGENDPSFSYESVFRIGETLRAAGITTIEGNIRIGDGVMLNMRQSPAVVGREFVAALDRERWNGAITRAWGLYQAGGRQAGEYQGVSVKPGVVLVDDRKEARKPLAEYRSSTLLRILKEINAYSNNEMTHVVGARIGGAAAVREFLIHKVKLSPGEVGLETTSGLGRNAVTPRAVVKIMRYAVAWLGKRQAQLSDLLPIAGVDNGTLQRRFTKEELVGSVIGKTGTLSSTSALAGVLYTKNRGPLYFAILEHGSPNSLRSLQEQIISIVAEDSGGAQSISLGSEMVSSICDDARVELRLK
jgi:D-alanyl-D-alanine carboxypeptidase/D-alanyl-D-alanine-endopeptidase (penicillin-binding protein 4)